MTTTSEKKRNRESPDLPPAGMSTDLKIHGARCTHLIRCMPYRDPARRAAWMREYRKRKRVAHMSVPVSPPSLLSIVRAPESSRVPQRMIERPDRQPVPPNTGLARHGAASNFRNALELARTFPIGMLASQVCPYCYNSGYSSPGTRCAYCRSAAR